MKKRVWRVLALVAVSALLCTSLCGCGAIDELRAANAIKVDRTTMEWNGTTYKRLDAVLSSEINVGGIDLSRMVYLNDDDVPALLLPFFCTAYNPTNNNVFLSYAGYSGFGGLEPDYSGSYVEYYTSYYCREDRYDDVVKQLQGELKLTGYLYEYYDYETNEQGVYHFSAEETTAFNRVLDVRNQCDYPYTYEYATSVSPCTNDDLLGDDMYDILQKSGVYYIAHYADMWTDYYTDYDVYDSSVSDYEDDSTVCYRVPEEYNEMFTRLLTDSMREQTYWDDEMTEMDVF